MFVARKDGNRSRDHVGADRSLVIGSGRGRRSGRRRRGRSSSLPDAWIPEHEGRQQGAHGFHDMGFQGILDGTHSEEL